MEPRDLEDLAQALERVAYAVERMHRELVTALAMIEELACECGVTLPVATSALPDIDDGIDADATGVGFSRN